MGNYLIAGASSGIGAACAKKLLTLGHTLVLVARNAEKLHKFAKSLSGEIYPFVYDLEDIHNIRSIFDYCRSKGILLDGMIYSAGINSDVPMKACTPEIMERVMKINCIAFADMAKHFYSKRYSNDNSRILAVSSSSSISCDKGMGPYSASKSALNAMVKTLSKEYVRRGILVNALLPAGVLTPMTAKKIETLTGVHYDLDNMLEQLENNPVQIQEASAQPYGVIVPRNLADIISYLISPDNKYITGALLPVSAGLVF